MTKLRTKSECKTLHIFPFQFRLWDEKINVREQDTSDPLPLILGSGGLEGLTNSNHRIVGISVVRERD